VTLSFTVLCSQHYRCPKGKQGSVNYPVADRGGNEDVPRRDHPGDEAMTQAAEVPVDPLQQ
jgi:hypothetical protein